MPGSRTLGVRIPEHVLAGVDRFAQARELTRSRAIAVLVEWALSEGRMEPGMMPASTGEDASERQSTASGQRAQQWGIRTARKIAAALGGERVADRPIANEFWLGGKRVAIKCARPATTQCGLTNTMRDRVDYILCASQTADGTFRLFKVTPEQWARHANTPPRHNRNYATLTHLSRSVYRRIGEDLGEVEIED